MANTIDELNSLFSETFKKDIEKLINLHVKPNMTVSEWLSSGSICNDDISSFSNAKIAAEIKNSPLYKALE